MEKILTPTNYERIPLSDKTNVRFYTSVDPGSYVAPHWHDALEIIYMQEGELKVIVDNKVRELMGNQCMLIGPNQIHATLCTRPNRAVVCQIPEGFMEKFIPDTKYLDFIIQDPADTERRQSKVDMFKNTLSRMQVLGDGEVDGAVLRFNSLLFEALFQLYHNFSVKMDKSDFTRRNKNLERLKPVLDYVTENYNRAISIHEIAGVAMFEPKYFCRYFKKCMGMTFLEYQNEIRLSKIYEDIVSTDHKISDILEQHGFTNDKLFRRMFRSHFNATPTQLRKEMENYELFGAPYKDGDLLESLQKKEET